MCVCVYVHVYVCFIIVYTASYEMACVYCLALCSCLYYFVFPS